VASGTVSELTSGTAGSGAPGWDIIVSGLSDAIAERLRARVARVTKIADGRYSLELPTEAHPETFIAELASMGASLVSVMPLRTTLEDVFLRALGRGES
jgi:hypothetical protein